MHNDGSFHRWQDALTEQNIHLLESNTSPLALPTGVVIDAQNKWTLIESLCTALCTREKLDATISSAIHKELIAREKLMSTGIGEQMAIPHAVIPEACRFMTECVIIKNGLDFDSIDTHKAYIVVLLVAPKAALQEHLQVMASIARVFYKVEARTQFIAARTATDALQIVRAHA
ncbi:MAG TPA: PTS sugar transporter subunit IIA [Turneriella sp.]|nr:PTS sugar transporter subunit IIA [Turneriella sp.]